MDVLIYVANGLYLASYFVRDILRLRLLTVVAALCLMTYFASRPQPLMEVVYWNLFFIVLNVFQIARIVNERRSARRNAAPGGVVTTNAGAEPAAA